MHSNFEHAKLNNCIDEADLLNNINLCNIYYSVKYYHFPFIAQDIFTLDA